MYCKSKTMCFWKAMHIEPCNIWLNFTLVTSDSLNFFMVSELAGSIALLSGNLLMLVTYSESIFSQKDILEKFG